MKKIIAAIALSALASTSFAGFAPVSPTITSTPTKKTDNKFYAGLNWTLGESAIPQFVLGFRNAKVTSGGDVYGSSVSMSFHLAKPGPGKLKLGYFEGKDDLQGEAGLGYDFASNKFLGGIGVQGPYLTGVLDYLLGGTFEPYLGVNSIGKYKKPAANTVASCPVNYTLSGGTCVFNPV